MMHAVKFFAAAMLLVSIAACSKDIASAPATPAPSGLATAGSASVSGGAAAVSPAVGTVGRTRY